MIARHASPRLAAERLLGFTQMPSRQALSYGLSILLTVVAAAVLVFLVEWTVRGSLAPTIQFFSQPFRPSWATVALFALLFWFFDALLGRAHNGLLIIAPLALMLAFINHQKALYLGDPLYPADLLYTRQIMELMPLLVRERPGAAVAICAGVIAVILGLLALWRAARRKLPRLRTRARLLRLTAALPALVFRALSLVRSRSIVAVNSGPTVPAKRSTSSGSWLRR